MFLNAELFLVGLGVGSFGTLIGVGGGFILVPVFCCCFTILPSSRLVPHWRLSSSMRCQVRLHICGKKVYYDAAIRFSLATLPGAVIGGYLARYFTSNVFFISFALLLISIACLLYLAVERRRRN